MDVYIYNRLFSAARNGRLEIARELINTYGLSYSEHWSNGYNFLYVALEHKHADVAELLLSKGSKVNIKSANGPCNTPLHLAASNNYIKVVEMILNKNGRIEAEDQHGRTPLVVAIGNNATEAAELLLKHVADVNTIDNIGNSPLHWAIARRHKEISSMLLAKGADVNAKRNDGCTPLHMAVDRRFQEMIIMLLAKGADVNAMALNGSTPLHHAVENGDKEISTMLLTKGADVNAKRKDGRTPLHLAVQFCSHDFIETILKFGADMDARDDIEWIRYTSIYIAFVNKDLKMVETLLEHGCDFADVAFAIAKLDNDEAKSYRDVHSHDHQNIVTRVEHHIVKMLAANLYVSKPDLDFIVNGMKNKMSDFHLECQEQIANMKSEKIKNTNISFYDILAKTASSLAIYMRNENVVQVFKSDNYETKFPIYASMIKRNFQKGMERKKLFEQGNQVFHCFINNFAIVSRECTEKILSYLSIKDVLILIDTFKPLKA